jgi:hypothetical protein
MNPKPPINPTTEEYWKVLRQEIPLPEIMRVFGSTQSEIDKYFEFLKKSNSIYYYDNEMLGYIINAYTELVKLKELSSTKVFNLATKKYANKRTAKEGDFGLTWNSILIYLDGKWAPALGKPVRPTLKKP